MDICRYIFPRIVLILIVCQQILSPVPITVINNAMFDSIDPNYLLTNLSNIKTWNACVCQCFAISNCIVINYYGSRQECLLFSTSLQPAQLRVMSTDKNATVVVFDNRNHVGKELITFQLCTFASNAIFK